MARPARLAPAIVSRGIVSIAWLAIRYLLAHGSGALGRQRHLELTLRVGRELHELLHAIGIGVELVARLARARRRVGGGRRGRPAWEWGAWLDEAGPHRCGCSTTGRRGSGACVPRRAAGRRGVGVPLRLAPWRAASRAWRRPSRRGARSRRARRRRRWRRPGRLG